MGPTRRVARISVLPDHWHLSRGFHFESSGERRNIIVDECLPPYEKDQIIQTSPDEWQIILRWSKEALEAAAYEMTFWYMEKVGEIIYEENLPKDWSEMSPAEAGRNAAKMMIYYALLRCKNERETQRAIALYNSYGFGCALGMNFVNAQGKREMFWPKDLDEIISSGKTEYGCRIKGS